MNEENLHITKQTLPCGLANKILSRYRSFLHENRFALQIVEDLVSRCILYYAPSSHHSGLVTTAENINDDENVIGYNDRGKSKKRTRQEKQQQKSNGGVMPESLYACINLWTFMNDAIYYGLGNDIGFTVGTSRFDQKDPSIPSSPTTGANNIDNLERHTSTFISTLRIILSIVDCIAPAIEVRAHYFQSLGTSKNNVAKKNTQAANNHRFYVLNILTKIERIRFICRLSILLLNYYNQYKKMIRSESSSPSKNTNENRQNSSTSIDKSYLAMFGIIENGGLYQLGCNNDNSKSTRDEVKRVKRMLYVGKRTGRKVSNQRNLQRKGNLYQEGDDLTNILQSISKRLLDSTSFKICLLAMGEILHLSRPLYQTYAIRNCERQNNFGLNDQKNRKQNMIKIWVISLLMDMLSLECTKLGTTVNVNPSMSSQRSTQTVNIASSMTKDEIYHRKMRLFLYLLRTPVFDFTTLPVAKRLSQIINHVPLVGRLSSSYIMDLITYWHDWHFMMEK